MSNKISALAIVGLSAICVTMLWNNRKHNSDPVAGSVPQAEQKADEFFDLGAVSVAESETQKFTADLYATDFTIIQRHKDKDKDKGLTLLEANRSELLKTIRAMGVESRDMEPSGLRITEDYDIIKGKRVDRGYNLLQSIIVLSSSKDRADSLESVLATFPFVEYVHTQGRLKNSDSVEVVTIRKACQRAMQTASEYAGGVNAKVGKVYSVKGDSYVSLYNGSDSVEVNANVAAELRLEGVKDGGKSFVEVTQEETQKFAADKFVAEVEISLKGANKDQLYKSVQEKMDSVLMVAKNLGVAESELDVRGAMVRRRNSRVLETETDKSNIFEAHQRVHVHFVSRKDAAAFVAEISPIKNAVIGYVRPKLRNEDSLRVQVVNAAGKKALARARALAEGFDCKMGRVISVANEGGLASIQPLMEYQGMTKRRKSSDFTDGLAGLLGGGDEMNVADSVEISAFLHVIAEME